MRNQSQPTVPLLTTRRLVESAKIDPNWRNNTRGIYADFKDGQDKPRFYCKCPNCSYVHGDYKTFADAYHNRPCPLCKAKEGLKYRDEVQKSIQPERVRKPNTFRLRVESIARVLLDR